LPDLVHAAACPFIFPGIKIGPDNAGAGLTHSPSRAEIRFSLFLLFLTGATCMGRFVDFRCTHCRYEETDIGIGKGKHPFPYLALFRCVRCKSTGSTWIKENEAPRCAVCYEVGVTLLPDDTTRIDCPRCGKPAQFVPKEGSWE